MDNTSMDNKIKHFFEQRTIHPSAQTWDRLDAMLTVAEKPKMKKTPLFILIAASFTPVIMVCFWLIFNKDASKITSGETIVKSENHVGQNRADSKTENIVADTPLHISGGKNKSWQQNKENQELRSVQPPVKNVDQRAQTLYPSVSEQTEVIVVSNNISDIQKGYPDDIDASLVQTQSTITSTENIDNSTYNDKNELVDADSQNKDAVIKYKYGLDPEKLLKEAEYKSQQSFLSKVFKTLTEKSSSVVTAVSTRNELKAR
jgi:hypothetical protein